MSRSDVPWQCNDLPPWRCRNWINPSNNLAQDSAFPSVPHSKEILSASLPTTSAPAQPHTVPLPSHVRQSHQVTSCFQYYSYLCSPSSRWWTYGCSLDCSWLVSLLPPYSVQSTAGRLKFFHFSSCCLIFYSTSCFFLIIAFFALFIVPHLYPLCCCFSYFLFWQRQIYYKFSFLLLF